MEVKGNVKATDLYPITLLPYLSTPRHYPSTRTA